MPVEPGAQLSCISIHAPREGGDAVLGDQKHGTNIISIHAPREGGDSMLESVTRVPKDFNPRPPRGGRRAKTLEKDIPNDISIHAPREGGDPCWNP